MPWSTSACQPSSLSWRTLSARTTAPNRVSPPSLVGSDSGEVKKEGGEQPGAILAAGAMDDDPSAGGVRNRAKGRSNVRLEALEEDQVDVAGRRRHIGRCRNRRVELFADLLPFSLTRLHERHVHDLDRQLGRRIVLTLVVAAEVDHRADAVVDERLPPGRAQVADVVAPHHSAAA